MMRLYRVVTGFYVAGFLVDGGIVVKAAPILKRLVGMTEYQALEDARGRGATVAAIAPAPALVMDLLHTNRDYDRPPEGGALVPA